MRCKSPPVGFIAAVRLDHDLKSFVLPQVVLFAAFA